MYVQMLTLLNKENENRDSRFFLFKERLRNSVDRDAMLHEK